MALKVYHFWNESWSRENCCTSKGASKVTIKYRNTIDLRMTASMIVCTTVYVSRKNVKIQIQTSRQISVFESYVSGLLPPKA